MTAFSLGKVCKVCDGPVYNAAKVPVCQRCRAAIASEQGALGGSRKHPGKGFGSRAVQDKAIATRKLRAKEKRTGVKRD